MSVSSSLMLFFPCRMVSNVFQKERKSKKTIVVAPSIRSSRLTPRVIVCRGARACVLAIGAYKLRLRFVYTNCCCCCCCCRCNCNHFNFKLQSNADNCVRFHRQRHFNAKCNDWNVFPCGSNFWTFFKIGLVLIMNNNNNHMRTAHMA